MSTNNTKLHPPEQMVVRQMMFQMRSTQAQLQQMQHEFQDFMQQVAANHGLDAQKWDLAMTLDKFIPTVEPNSAAQQVEAQNNALETQAHKDGQALGVIDAEPAVTVESLTAL